ncbi:MAG TPA: signal peptidase I [Candidatus Paceibacterota bacterium]
MRQALSIIFELGKIALVAFVLVVGLRMFVFQPFLVRGASMEPNFHNWDYLIVDEITYRLARPDRGDVIVFTYPNDPSQRYIKRIIGLPGETIKLEHGDITIAKGTERFVLDESRYLQGEETTGSISMTLGQNEYFVMGDNRRYSSDSRSWGVLPGENIIGRALIRIFPISAFAKVQAPAY